MNKEIEEFIKSYEFTTCDDCVHKVDKVYQEECCGCRHYYGDMFQPKEKVNVGM